MKSVSALIVFSILSLGATTVDAQTSLLFIGNSFTYGHGSSVRFYRADSVTDLNGSGIGGVPALFKSFADQAGLDYEVYVETQPGSGLDFHLENRLGVIEGKPWDRVVMHGFSTLDRDNPGNPELLVRTTAQMTEFLQGLNSEVEVFLTATWSRADLIYQSDSPWAGTPIEKMAQDLRDAYNLAAAGTGGVRSVNAVGEAWTRAMKSGLADPNPYDGIDADTIDLWTYDHYHASAFGYYLEALVVFGNLTGLDPRSLGDSECSAFELGFAREQTAGLQQVAFDELASDGRVEPAAPVSTDPVPARACAPAS